MSSYEKSSRVIGQDGASGFVIHIFTADTGWYRCTQSAISALYRRCTTLQDFKNRLNLSPRLARKALKFAKVKYLKDLRAEYVNGATWGQVARRHGMKLATLTSLIKGQGYEVLSGRRRPKIPKRALKISFERHNIVAHVAADFKVHWKTAYNALKSAGLNPPPIHRRKIGPLRL
jgi:hypothetical protein